MKTASLMSGRGPQGSELAGRAPLFLFGVGLLIALAAAVLSWLQIRRLIEDAERVDQSRRVLEVIESLRRFLARAEASQRGWILTREASFREKEAAARRGLQASLEEAGALTADHPAQQGRCRELAPLLEERGSLLDKGGDDGPTALRERIRQGDLVTDRILGILRTMETEERGLLESRNADSHRSADRTLLAGATSGAVSCASFAMGMALYIRETRRRRRAEAAILQANARLEAANLEIREAGAQVEAFFNKSLDLTAVADFDGRFRKLNPAWEKVLGWPLAELLARPWLDFIHPDDRTATIQAAERLGAGATLIQFQNRYRCRDGGYRWLSWNVPAPVPGSSTLYSTARDVTDLKAAEERILALNKELEAFSYSVSHDLRAPLRHANGFVELLQKHAGPALDDKSRRYLKTISDAVNKMGRLIDDLLSFSRSGRGELKSGHVGMASLVEEVRRDLQADMEGRSIVWDLKPLPDAWGDPALLRQVWINLLSNAVKYTRHRAEARIEVGTESGNGQGPSCYYVRDNGAGFDMKYADKLFGVFQRLHASHEFEGTGVGLANVKRIVARHGGSIWAEAKVGEGAVFYFTVPLAGEVGR